MKIVIFLVIVYFGYYIYLNNKNDGDVAVLAYHHFMSKEEKAKYDPNNYNIIDTENFEEQLKYLKENNYNSISIEQLECFMKNECEIPKKAILITIDDGNISSYYKALPILEKYDFHSAIFIIGSRTLETTYNCSPENYCFIGKDLVNDIRNNHKSMAIGSHSYGLHDLIDNKNPIDILDYEKLYEDVLLAKEMLNTKCYAYPFGRYNDKIEKALKKANYQMAFTFKEDRKVKKSDDILKIPRIEIRGDYNLKQFARKIEGKISIFDYTKKIIKHILHIS